MNRISVGAELAGLRERALARRAADGEAAAFERIYERYHQPLYRYCLALLHDPSDAEDALQATMAAALRALPGEERQIELKPWLYRVAHNEAVTLLRGRQRSSAPAGLELELAEPAAEAVSADRERLRALVADLQALPERQRGAIVMRELSGLSYDEIALAFSSSKGAARQSVYEARVALKSLEEGRAMECGPVRRTLSENDGRRLRGRKLRAHLRSCEGCSDFHAAISQRGDDLQALFPPLPAAAAAGLLGGGAAVGGGAGATAAAVGGGIGASAAVKGAGILIAGIAAVGAADLSGVVSVRGGDGEHRAAREAEASPPRNEAAGGGGARGAESDVQEQLGRPSGAGSSEAAVKRPDTREREVGATGGATAQPGPDRAGDPVAPETAPPRTGDPIAPGTTSPGQGQGQDRNREGGLGSGSSSAGGNPSPPTDAQAGTKGGSSAGGDPPARTSEPPRGSGAAASAKDPVGRGEPASGRPTKAESIHSG